MEERREEGVKARGWREGRGVGGKRGRFRRN